MLYPVLAAILKPGALAEIVIPVQTGPQALWLGLASGLVGPAIPAVAGGRR